MVDICFAETPLKALGYKSRTVLYGQLDRTKVIPSPQGFPRDYRGLAEVADVNCNDIRKPTEGVIAEWCRKDPVPSFQDLIDSLGQIDRYDVIDDVTQYLQVDSVNYSLKQRQIVPASSAGVSQQTILTYDDADLVRIGLPPNQKYDAYLLYAEQDEELALEIIDTLENQYGLKLCVKDRDIMPGAEFEHVAIMNLISERCSKLIAVLTPNFLGCSAQTFVYHYTVADSIRERVNKIIPCVFQVSDDKEVTNKIFRLTFCKVNVNFTQINPWNNWNKLCRAIAPHLWDSTTNSFKTNIKAIENSASTKINLSNKISIQELPSSDKENEKSIINMDPPYKTKDFDQISSSQDMPSSSSTAYLLPKKGKTESENMKQENDLTCLEENSLSPSSSKNLSINKIKKSCKNSFKSLKKKFKKKEKVALPAS